MSHSWKRFLTIIVYGVAVSIVLLKMVDIVETVAFDETVPPSAVAVTDEPIPPLEIPEEWFEPIVEEAPVVTYYDCPLDNELQDYIRELCNEKDIPMSLVLAVIETESTFRADVISNGNYGLMQINKVNHDLLSEKYGITNFLDPYQNVLAGITMLSNHLNEYEDITLALMVYNAGAGGAQAMWSNGVYTTYYAEIIKERMEDYEKELK